MPGHAADTSTEYSGKPDLPETRNIEKAQVDKVQEKDFPEEIISREPYLPSKELIEAVNLSIALGRPLLLQGDPGCGKTCLAYAVAYELGLPLERCYIKSTSRAQDLLYTYDAVRRLYDVQTTDEKSKDIHNYIRLGPLGRAIARADFETNGRRSVVLIDEIDKADLDFPNDLLWELDRLEFEVAESPDMAYQVRNPKLRPIIIITHNEEKALPTAFLRRCIFHYLEFPEHRELLEKILTLHCLENEALNRNAIDLMKELRNLELSKKPGLSELIDWLKYLEAKKVSPEKLKTPLEKLKELPYVGALLKQFSDRKRVEKRINSEE